MKILLYTGYRTGSRSLGDWLSQELDIEYHHEPFNTHNPKNLEKYANFNLDKIKNCIVKISPHDNFDFVDIVNKFDKTIILYRNNIKEQSESFIWSKHKKIYHHHYAGEKFIYAYYTIDENFLKEHSIEIDNEVDRLKIENEYFASLNTGLLLSYEDLYFSAVGLSKMEKYLDIKFKTKLNPINKLRNGFVKKSII